MAKANRTLLKFTSYDDYVAVQTAANRRKLDSVWATDRELDAVAAHVRRRLPDAAFGLCHGVRNGYEVQRLRAALGVTVIGTDIADTATQFEHVLQWDFHELKPEWVGAVDFIYSNSWDHSYDPERLFANWMRCLRPNGLCFVHWTEAQSPRWVWDADCFGIEREELVAWLSAEYTLDALIDLPEPRPRRLMRRLKAKLSQTAFVSRDITLLVVKP